MLCVEHGSSSIARQYVPGAGEENGETYHLFIRLFLLVLFPATNSTTKSHSSCLHDLPCLGLWIHNGNIMLQLRVRVLSSPLAANKIHLLMLRGLQQHLRRDDTWVPSHRFSDILAGFQVWCEAEAFVVLHAGSGSWSTRYVSRRHSLGI